MTTIAWPPCSSAIAVQDGGGRCRNPDLPRLPADEAGQAGDHGDHLQEAAGTRIARQRLRELGMTHLPRGPKPATRANPGGLTERQVEILCLLAEGLPNTDIASRLFISVRTVDHHVAAVLQKLGVPGRREAARAATSLGLGGQR